MVSRNLTKKKFGFQYSFFLLELIIIIVFFAPAARAQEADRPAHPVDGNVSEESGLLNTTVELQAKEPLEPRETKIIPLLYVQVSYILDKLNQMKSPDGMVVYNEQDHTLILKDEAASLEAMSAFVKEVDISLETETLKLEHIRPEDIVQIVEEALTKHVGQVNIDKHSQSLIVTDTPLKIGDIKKLILQLDRVNKKVAVEAKTLQIVLNDEHIKGVDWEAIVSDYQSYTFPGFTGGRTDATRENQLSFGTVSQEDYDILLEALDTVGVVHTLSEQIMEIENGTTADIDVLPGLLTESGEKKNPVSNLPGPDLENSLEEKVIFHLTPNIGRDDRLTVSVEPEFVGAAGHLSDTASIEKAVVSIDSGATMVIGSLFKEVKVASLWKIPLLGDLPLLGFVFRNQGEEIRKAEMITFLKLKTVAKEK